jgi:hypothetical protein
VVPHRIVDTEPHEPAEHQVVVEPPICSRSERTVKNACSGEARNSFSGAIGGRPMAAYSEHVDRLLALIELLAPTVRAMRDTNATNMEVATVLRSAADVVDGRVTF